MAHEKGTIETVTSETTGSIDRDNQAAPNPCSYENAEIVLVVGNRVAYDIDLEAVITNIELIVLTDETGTVSEVFTATTGTIARDNEHDPSPVAYNDPTLATRGIVLIVDQVVSFNIDQDNDVSNVTPGLITPMVDGDNITLKTADSLVPVFEGLNMFGTCDRRTYEAAFIGSKTGVASDVTLTDFIFTKDLEEGETATTQTLPRSTVLSNQH